MISAEGRLREINLPSRSATSRHRSFSIRPLGPIVPVSWPPCPGSITMRPIFNPSARVSECSPFRVGLATGTGPMLSAIALSDSGAAALGKRGIAKNTVALGARGSSPSAALGGASARAVLATEAADAVRAEGEAAGVAETVVATAGAAEAELAEAAGFALGFEF